ncbi:MAG: tetratricopeptide repeat protein [Flavobacteriales bacterium]|nr:tetratricopeptide repeat protein [Flavobacteriales bacterium]
MRYFISLLLFVALVFQSCEDKKPKKIELNRANLDSLIKIFPDSISLLVKRGNLLFDELLYEEAMADAARAYRLDSNRTECRVLYAEALINSPKRSVDDLFTAHKIYKKIVKKEPKNVEALVGLANTFSMFEDYENSFKYINQALRINPRYRDAYVLKGTNYRNQGNFKLAVSSYETAVQQDPKFYGGYLMLGALYQFKEDPICIEYYTTAYKIQPKNLDVIYSLAYAKQLFGKENAASALYRKMIRLDSTYHEAYFQLGYMKQFTTMELDSALFFYEKATEVQPKHIESYHNMGLIYEDKKDITNALFSYAKVLKINPEFELTKERVEILKKKR